MCSVAVDAPLGCVSNDVLAYLIIYSYLAIDALIHWIHRGFGGVTSSNDNRPIYHWTSGLWSFEVCQESETLTYRDS